MGVGVKPVETGRGRVSNSAFRRIGLGVGRVLIGGRFTDALAEMKRVQWLPPAELKRRNEKNLASILRHAISEVPYYRGLGLCAEDVNDREVLPRFPVMDKASYRAEPIERFLAMNVPAFRRLEDTTSGSTGEPFRFFLDRRANAMVFASHLFYDSWFDLKPFYRYVRVMAPPPEAPPFPPGTPLSFQVKQRVASCIQGTYERWTQRRFSLFDIDPECIETIYRTMEAFRPAFILGYTSTLAIMADELSRRELRLGRPLKAVVTIAEMLTPVRRRQIEGYFGAPIINRYGQREFKYWCAQSIPGDPERFSVNTGLVTWETLRQDGSSAGPGEIGRVVLTNLHNEVMPFIRYETGDLATMSEEPSSCGRGFPIVAQLEGRSHEVFTTPSGRMVSPVSLGQYLFVTLDYVDQIRHFQLVQPEPNRVELRVVPYSGLGEERRVELRRDMGELLGADMQVEVIEVKEIPLERSGKRLTIKVGG